jgi:hypothetical protein
MSHLYGQGLHDDQPFDDPLPFNNYESWDYEPFDGTVMPRCESPSSPLAVSASSPTTAELPTTAVIPASPPGRDLPALRPGVSAAPKRARKPKSERKPNRIPKGQGKEADPDALGRDGYDYQNLSFFYRLLMARLGDKPHQPVTFGLCKAVIKMALPGLTEVNRWVTRRMPCAFCWLEENRQLIYGRVLDCCLHELATSGIAPLVG